MSAPRPVVRAVVYERDLERCVRCGATTQLTFQHRQAVGMGGSPRLVGFVDGVTACAGCNARFESDLQRVALDLGWKVPRWVEEPAHVPVFYAWEGRWCRLEHMGARVPIDARTAAEMRWRVFGRDHADAH